MIKFLFFFTNQGIPKISLFYDPKTPEQKKQIQEKVMKVILDRDIDACNFIDDQSLQYWDTHCQIVYKRSNSIFMALVIDDLENELESYNLLSVIESVFTGLYPTYKNWEYLKAIDKCIAILNDIICNGFVIFKDVHQLQQTLYDEDKL